MTQASVSRQHFTHTNASLAVVGRSGSGQVVLFAITIFLGAFLLFQVQPIMGKYILPWFGGSPGVWTTCMLVFQILLFAGYSYAHLLSKWLVLKSQILFHMSLLALAMCTLPIAPDVAWKPSPESSPIWLIMCLLICKVGSPYFLLSATGPLLQSWLTQSRVLDKPYRLYSLSNVGSLLALLSFPFVFEPAFSSPEQSGLWSVSFVAYGILFSAAGWSLYRSCDARDVAPGSSQPNSRIVPAEQVTKSTWFGWFVCAALPSTMLLATTNQVCQDTAVIPFLWVIPLAVYLLSFILTFDSPHWYYRRPCIQLAALTFLVLYASRLIEWKLPLAFEIVLYFAGLFFSCMVCHGELVASRPSPSKLTLFYMTISAGGAVGGLFVGLVAPNLFQGFYEFQLTLLCCLMLFLGTYLQSSKTWTTFVPVSCKYALAIGIPIVAVFWLIFWNAKSNQQIVARRNFYGVLSVTEGSDDRSGQLMRKLVHGRVVHGSQFREPDLVRTPTTYYTPTSGVGRTLLEIASKRRRVGVVGLGAGTLATYGNAGDYYRFYEINPDVIDLAQSYFTFLKDSRASSELILGDARLQLERESSQQLDLLVLDAFSGDAIPVHLLTDEAMQIYRRHLATDGKIAIHISNLYFDLQSVVLGLAEAQGLQCRTVQGKEGASLDAHESTWVILAKDANQLDFLEPSDRANQVPTGKPILWTDEKSNLFEVLK
jgi:hypothetical protein